MDVIHATTSYPGPHDEAAGIFVSRLVQAQRDRGHNVGVVTPSGADRGVVASLRSPARLPWAATATVVLTARLAWHARGATIVHAHWWPTALLALLTSTRPVVVTLHGSDVRLLQSRMLVRLAATTLRRCAAVVAVSASLAHELKARTGIKATVVEHGDDVSEGAIAPTAVGTDVLFVGRLSHEKGAAQLPAIVAGLREQLVTAPVCIIGDGPLRSAVEQGLAHEVAAGTVRFTGRVSPAVVEQRMAQAAVMVCPSHAEGYGLACREALNRGVPVVASAVGGLVDQLAANNLGRLVPSGDVAAMAREVAVLMADTDSRRRFRQAAASARASIRTWGDAAADYEAIYRAVRSGSAAGRRRRHR